MDISKIRVETNHYSLEQIMNLVKNCSHEVLYLSEEQCFWIENLLIGLPVPTIAWDENYEPGDFRVFKATQFIYGLWAFIDNGLVLTHMQFLPELVGKSFNDLPLSMRRKFGKEYNVFYIYPGVPKEIAECIIDRY